MVSGICAVLSVVPSDIPKFRSQVCRGVQVDGISVLVGSIKERIKKVRNMCKLWLKPSSRKLTFNFHAYTSLAGI